MVFLEFVCFVPMLCLGTFYLAGVFALYFIISKKKKVRKEMEDEFHKGCTKKKKLPPKCKTICVACWN